MERTEHKRNQVSELYPMTKFYMVILLSAVTLMMPGIISKAAGFLVMNIVAVISGVYGEFIRKTLKSVGLIFIILLIIQTLFSPGEQILFSFWIFSGKMEGLVIALNLGFVLLTIGGGLVWFFTITEEKDFILALEKMGMNPKASYVVLSTLQMVPVLKKRSQTIMNAQKARGVETEGSIFIRAKVFVPTLVPLVLSSIQGIEERALTLEARGFSLDTARTHLHDIEERPVDRRINVILLLLLIIAIGGRIALWLI